WRVALVATTEIGHQRVAADVGTFRLPPPRTDSGVRTQVHLHVGVRRDDRADVAALHHDVAGLGQLSLPLAHDLAHGAMRGDDGNLAVDARLADRRRDVGAGDAHAPAVLERDRTRRRQLAQR